MVYLFVVACTVADCAKCPTNKDVCTECGDGKGVDSNGATCTGKLFFVLKCNLFHLIRTIIIVLSIFFFLLLLLLVVVVEVAVTVAIAAAAAAASIILVIEVEVVVVGTTVH